VSLTVIGTRSLTQPVKRLAVLRLVILSVLKPNQNESISLAVCMKRKLFSPCSHFANVSSYSTRTFLKLYVRRVMQAVVTTYFRLNLPVASLTD
jgi:hypothetical protein